MALCKALILGSPDFTKLFVLEIDTCAIELRVVLSQEGRPLAYLSKALYAKHIRLSIYEKEYLAILIVVEMWRHYLEHDQLIIKTDHESLKYLYSFSYLEEGSNKVIDIVISNSL